MRSGQLKIIMPRNRKSNLNLSLLREPETATKDELLADALSRRAKSRRLTHLRKTLKQMATETARRLTSLDGRIQDVRSLVLEQMGRLQTEQMMLLTVQNLCPASPSPPPTLPALNPH
jgi:hypothetical protein